MLKFWKDAVMLLAWIDLLHAGKIFCNRNLSMVNYLIFGITYAFAAARNLGSRVSRISVGISVIAFVSFGFYQLWSGISGF